MKNCYMMYIQILRDEREYAFIMFEWKIFKAVSKGFSIRVQKNVLKRKADQSLQIWELEILIRSIPLT